MSEQKFYILSSEGVAYEAELKLCANIQEVMSDIADGSVFFAGQISKDMYYGVRTGPNNTKEDILIRELSHLSLNVGWETRSGITTMNTGNERRRLEWKVPEGMRLFFCWSDSEYYLIAVRLSDKAIIDFPMPNIYLNTKLCTGSLDAVDHNMPAIDRMEYALISWSANGWNSDLSEEHPNFRGNNRAMVRFDENLETMAPSKPLEEFNTTESAFRHKDLINNIIGG